MSARAGSGRLIRPVARVSHASPRVLTIITCAAILGVGVVAAALALSRDRAGEAVEHSHEVMRSAEESLHGLIDAESGQAWVLLTRTPAYLETFRDGERASITGRDRLKALTADNPALRGPVGTLDRLSGAKLAVLHRTIELGLSGADSAATAVVRTGYGKLVMDSVRAEVGAIGRTEQRLLDERRATERRLRGWLLAALGVGMLVTGILASAAGLSSARALRREHELNSRLTDLNKALQDANAELEVANEEMHSANEEVASSNARLEAARSEIETNRGMLQSIIEGTPDAVFLKDRSLRYLVVNEGAARVLGGTPQQVLGKTDPDLFPPEVLAWLVPQDRRIMDTGQTEVVEEQVDVAGKQRWFLTTKSPWRDERGRIVGLIGIARDITERRDMELRLRQVGRLEAVGRLGGGVAHEVNNQMTVVLGYTAFLLQRDDLADSVREDVRSIRHAAERSAKTTSQLLAFSRRQFFRSQVQDVHAVIRQFAPVLQRTLTETQTAELRLHDGTLEVNVDRGQLEEVLLNLTINAVDAMPDGGVLMISTAPVALTAEYVQLRREVSVRPGRYVMLVVSDTGSGMNPETIAHAFEPFFTTKPIGRGTGLGLSSVYGIVKQSDGYIWLYSEPGQGTTVKIYIPEVSQSAPAAPAPTERDVSRVTGRVLVVEDDQVVRHMMVRAMEEVGFTVLEAADGEKALALIREDPGALDLVVTDIAMPGMDGRRLASAVANLRPLLPVLTTSGYTDDEIVRRGMLDASVPFLQKPFAPDELVARARDLVEGTRR